ncbi:sugar kinase [soil metagenome]|jgi:2-dehydro-3-deoxygluconokinase|nr:sugar kinase [Acidobacteriota bacterium]
MNVLQLRSSAEYRWDLISLGELLLRFDSGDERIHNARIFRVWDGGGEYNVARNLSKIFRQRTAIVTALADNTLGRLAEDLANQGGVDTSHIIWREENNKTRNGIYFIERGFGLRAPTSCFDRANTAVSQLKAGEINWQEIFGKNDSRWFHTGGIFSGLSETTPEVARDAMQKARKSGAIVSFDLNYRDSLWKMRGGKTEANKINKKLLPFADVVFGICDYEAKFADFNAENFRQAAEQTQMEFPNLKVIATTLREIKSAGQHNLSAAVFANGEVFKARDYLNVHVLDRVGSGDAFAAGFIFGLLSNKGIHYALECGTAHACLVMTTPGDNSMARLGEIEQLMQGADSNVVR